jgi:hypothetical protein
LPNKRRGQTLNCKLCSREAGNDSFCQLHSKAYSNVLEKFRVWEAALNVTWNQYLVDIQKNSLTGVWAKDVAMYLIEEENQK